MAFTGYGGFVGYRFTGNAGDDGPPTGQGQITDIIATAGNGTTTLAWTEAGTLDSVNIYRDDVLVDSIFSGVETWTSPTLDDGLYEWYVAPVTATVEGDNGDGITFGCMTGDVWVDATNGDDSNDGSTPALAVATLNDAGGLVNAAGMRIVVRGGTYSEYNSRSTSATYGSTPTTTFTQNGTVGSRCELRSFPGENVIIDGSSVTRPLDAGATDPNRPELLTIEGEYWTVEGWPGYPIDLRNSAGCGVRVDETPTGVTLRYVNSHDHEGSGFNVQSSRNCTIEYFAAWSCYSTVNSGETSDGVQAGGSSGPINGSDGLTLRYGFVAWNGDDGVDLITATNGWVENVIAYRNGYFIDGTPGSGNGNGFKMGGDLEPTEQDNTFVYNIAFENREIGFNANQGHGLVVAHNTSIGNDRNYTAREGGTTVQLISNVSYDGTSSDLIDGNFGDAPTESYNSWNTPPGVTVDATDFQNLTFNEAWRSWAEALAANFAKLALASDLKAADEDGDDLGFEGEYTPPVEEPEPQSASINSPSGLDDGLLQGTTASDSYDNAGNRMDMDASDYHAFMRFLMPAGLLPGATLTEATITLGFNGDAIPASTLEFWCYDADNAAAPTNATEAAAQIAALTTASATWNAPITNHATAYESTDIKAPIQEVIDRVGFAEGDAIVIWFTSSSLKDVYSRNLGVANLRPLLNLTWVNAS